MLEIHFAVKWNFSSTPLRWLVISDVKPHFVISGAQNTRQKLWDEARVGWRSYDFCLLNESLYVNILQKTWVELLHIVVHFHRNAWVAKAICCTCNYLCSRGLRSFESRGGQRYAASCHKPRDCPERGFRPLHPPPSPVIKLADWLRNIWIDQRHLSMKCCIGNLTSPAQAAGLHHKCDRTAGLETM